MYHGRRGLYLQLLCHMQGPYTTTAPDVQNMARDAISKIDLCVKQKSVANLGQETVHNIVPFEFFLFGRSEKGIFHRSN